MAVAEEEEPEDDGSPPTPSLKQFESVWQLRLRRPLVDASAKPKARKKAIQTRPPASFRATLLGTMMESEKAFAMFSTLGGGVEVRKVGERIGHPETGAEVLRIDAKEVAVRFQGREFVLRLEQTKGSQKR